MAIWNGTVEIDLRAYRRGGVSMLKAVLSKTGVIGGMPSSAQRGPRREDDCVVAKVGIERVVPSLEG